MTVEAQRSRQQPTKSQVCTFMHSAEAAKNITHSPQHEGQLLSSRCLAFTTLLARWNVNCSSRHWRSLSIPDHWDINEANQDLLNELEKMDVKPTTLFSPLVSITLAVDMYYSDCNTSGQSEEGVTDSSFTNLWSKGMMSPGDWKIMPCQPLTAWNGVLAFASVNTLEDLPRPMGTPPDDTMHTQEIVETEDNSLLFDTPPITLSLDAILVDSPASVDICAIQQKILQLLKNVSSMAWQSYRSLLPPSPQPPSGWTHTLC